MQKGLTLYDLKKLERGIDLLNAKVGLQSETIKDVRWKIKQAEDKIKEEEIK